MVQYVVDYTNIEMIMTEEICSKYTGSVKFNGIPRERNREIPINSYKDQCLDHMIRNGMWDVFSTKDRQNKERR